MSQLTPTQLIKKAILKTVPGFFKDFECPNALLTGEDIEAAWEYGEENDYLQDATQEFRSGQVEADGVDVGWSRHCEIKPVAAQIDGVWVCWGFEYGGGRHFEESGNWLYDAFFVECIEEERLVTIRTFKKSS